jgi:hypothetical protein
LATGAGAGEVTKAGELERAAEVEGDLMRVTRFVRLPIAALGELAGDDSFQPTRLELLAGLYRQPGGLDVLFLYRLLDAGKGEEGFAIQEVVTALHFESGRGRSRNHGDQGNEGCEGLAQS